MNFSTEGRDEPLTTQTDSGASVVVFFKAGALDYAEIDGYEFAAPDDALNTFYVMIGKKAYSIRQVMLEALKQRDDILAELIQDEEDEIAHIEYVSCPSKTGRI